MATSSSHAARGVGTQLVNGTVSAVEATAVAGTRAVAGTARLLGRGAVTLSAGAGDVAAQTVARTAGLLVDGSGAALGWLTAPIRSTAKRPANMPTAGLASSGPPFSGPFASNGVTATARRAEPR